jgi:CspA family cold shock protein
MSLGTVVWYSAETGHGFIRPWDGGSDVFVDLAEVCRAGASVLREGQRVRYEVARQSRRDAATHLVVIG